MNAETPKLIAIVGGSGAGKSWLADRLQLAFGQDAARLSLDDFYHDFSHVAAPYRDRINFDDPSAIDWALVERVLHDCRVGRAVKSPRYDFTTHTRRTVSETWMPRPIVFVDGLWLLWRPSIRALFDLRIFVESPEDLRWRRRLERDVVERKRTQDSVREQFWNTVAPMHNRYVEPQMYLADMVLHQPFSESEVSQLTHTIREILVETYNTASEEMETAQTA